jgi:hypothetical protein
MTPAAANHLAVRMLMGFLLAFGTLLLGVVLIRRMRQLVDDEFVAEPRPERKAAREHRPILPPQATIK